MLKRRKQTAAPVTPDSTDFAEIVLEQSTNSKPTENAIRPTALGKKNWLFIGAANTGERSAIIYSIIESCRRHGFDPHAYLSDILERIPDATTTDIPALTPAAWAQAQKTALPKAD